MEGIVPYIATVLVAIFLFLNCRAALKSAWEKYNEDNKYKRF